jgi:Transglycosylase-like domain
VSRKRRRQPATVRRLLTKRTHILVAVLVAAFLLPVGAHAGPDEQRVGLSNAKALSVARIAPPVAQFHRAIRVVRRQIRAERRAELRRQRREAFARLPAGVEMATLEAIAACESGGDPAIVSSDGSYRGKYQFSFETWASVGGSGDPAAASEAEQDYRAALLYASAGSSPWPVCGV